MKRFEHIIWAVNDHELNEVIPFTQLDISLTNRNSNCRFEEWKVTQNDWQEKIKIFEENLFHSIIVPYNWISKPDFVLDPDTLKMIEDESLRVLSFVKKDMNINHTFPCLTIPLDRGKYIENIFLNFASNPDWDPVWPALSEEAISFEIKLSEGIDDIKKVNSWFFKKYSTIYPGLPHLELKNKVALRTLLKAFQVSNDSHYQIAADKSVLGISITFPVLEFKISTFLKNKKLKSFGITCSCYWISFNSEKKEIQLNYLLSFDSERFNSYPLFSNPFPLGLVYSVNNKSSSILHLVKNEVDSFPGLNQISFTPEEHTESELSGVTADLFAELVNEEESGQEDNKQDESVGIVEKIESLETPVILAEDLGSFEHMIYFVENSCVGRGIEHKKFEEFLNKTDSGKIKNWDVEQFEWEDKIEDIKFQNFSTFILPSAWTVEIEDSPPEDLAESIEDGNCRLVIPSIKNDLAIFNFPLFRLPTDRGKDILNILWPLVCDKKYRDLDDLFIDSNLETYNTEVYSENDTQNLYQVFFNSLFEKYPKAKKDKLKINLIASSMINLIYNELNIEKRRKTAIKCIVGENILGFSFRWESRSLTYFDWTAERTDLQRIFKTCSCIWFNIFPKFQIVEAMVLFNIGPDRDFSYPLGGNLYPMGVEFFGSERLTKESTLKELEGIKSAEVPTLDVVDVNDIHLEIEENSSTHFYCIVSEEALTLRGVTFDFVNKFLTSQFSYLKVSKLTAEQDKFYDEVFKNYEEDRVMSVIIPSIWLVDYQDDAPEKFKELVNLGKIRIATMIEKSDPPYYGYPYFSIPTDRGDDILKKTLQSFFSPVYMGIFTFNPLTEKIIVTKPLRHLENLQDIVEEFIHYFSVENDNISKLKPKINMVLKGLSKWIFKEEGLPEIFFQFIIDSTIAEVLTVSVRWETGKESEYFFTENKTWKSLAMSSSGFWFNHIIDTGEIEAFFLFSLSKDNDFSFPLPKNSYPLGLDLILSNRMTADIQCETNTINEFPSLLIGKLKNPSSLIDKSSDSLLEEISIPEEKPKKPIFKVVHDEIPLIESDTINRSDSLNSIQDQVHKMKGSNIIKDEVRKISSNEKEDLTERIYNIKGGDDDSNIINEEVTKILGQSKKDVEDKVFKIKGNPNDSKVDTNWVSKSKAFKVEKKFTIEGHNPLTVLMVGRTEDENYEYMRVFREKKLKVISFTETSKAITTLKDISYSGIFVCTELGRGNVNLFIKSVKNPNNKSKNTPIFLIMNKIDLDVIKLNKKLVKKILAQATSSEELFINFSESIPKEKKKNS